MKKIYIIFFALFLLSFFLPINSYHELNHIIIADYIQLKCNNSSYHLIVREVLPTKDDDGIVYRHKKYSVDGNHVDLLISKIEKKEHKVVYYNKAKIKYINCSKNIKLNHKSNNLYK